VYGGYAESNDLITLFDVNGFVEKDLFDQVHETSSNAALIMNWYVKVI